MPFPCPLRHPRHLHIASHAAPSRELSVHPHFALRQPHPRPDDRLDDHEDNDGRHEDDDDVGCDPAAATRARRPRVEEAIRVEPLGRVRYVCQREVQRKDDDDPEDVHPRRRGRAWDEQLEEREERVYGVLRDLFPGLVGGRVPGPLIQYGPVDDGNQEGKGHDGGVVERVQGLQGPRKAVEEGPGGEGVGEGVGGGDEEVEQEAPIGEDGEVGELGADRGAALWGLAPAGYDDDAGDEDVEADCAVC
ncbi:hypothetical protein VUR80DRAFT_9933 [Thermomyces stellatus]